LPFNLKAFALGFIDSLYGLADGLKAGLKEQF